MKQMETMDEAVVVMNHFKVNGVVKRLVRPFKSQEF